MNLLLLLDFPENVVSLFSFLFKTLKILREYLTKPMHVYLCIYGCLNLIYLLGTILQTRRHEEEKKP